jgi:predicted kinase
MCGLSFSGKTTFARNPQICRQRLIAARGRAGVRAKPGPCYLSKSPHQLIISQSKQRTQGMKASVFIATSLDGFIAREDGEGSPLE